MSNQHSNHKRIAKNTAMLYVRQLFSMAVSLFTAGIVLRELGVTDFGIYNVVGGVVTLFSFLQSSMATGTQRFMNVEMGRGNFDRLQKVFSTSLTIHIAIAVIIFILAETIGLWFVNYELVIPPDRMLAANVVYQFSVVGAMLTITQSPYTAAIIANEKMSIYGYFGIAEALMRLVLLYLLVTIQMDKLILYAILVFGVGTMFLIIYWVYCLKKFPECHFHKPDEKVLYNEMIGFAGWNLFGNIASVGMNQGQNILLNLFFGPIVNAAQAIAGQVNSAIYQFSSNFIIAINPQITKCYSVGEREHTNTLIIRGAKFSFFLLFIVASPVLIKTPEILVLWLKTPPEYAAIFCRLILVNTLVMCTSHTLYTGIYATGKIKLFQIVSSVVLLLNLPISYFLLASGWQPQTIYCVTILLSLVSIIIRLIVADKLLHFGKRNFIIKVFLRCWLLFIIAIPIEYCISVLLPKNNVFIIIVMLICAIISATTVFFLGMTKSERLFVVNFIVSKIKLAKR